MLFPWNRDRLLHRLIVPSQGNPNKLACFGKYLSIFTNNCPFYHRHKYTPSSPSCLKSSGSFFHTVPWDLTLVANLWHITVICMLWLDGHLFICRDQFTAWHLFIRPSWGCLHLTYSLYGSSLWALAGLRSKDSSFLCSKWDLNWNGQRKTIKVNCYRYSLTKRFQIKRTG